MVIKYGFGLGLVLQCIVPIRIILCVHFCSHIIIATDTRTKLCLSKLVWQIVSIFQFCVFTQSFSIYIKKIIIINKRKEEEEVEKKKRMKQFGHSDKHLIDQ